MRIVGPFAGLEEYVSENVPLAKYTWFRLGGPARWMIRPRDLEELREAVRRCVDNNIPIYVLGLGANLLVSDAGVNAAVFRLSADHWRGVTFEKDSIRVGAGMEMQKLLLKCIRQGRSGLECIAGVPGTIGGGVRMNAGGRFGSIGTIVRSVTVMDTLGAVFERTRDDIVFDYRRCNILARFILEAVLETEEDDPHRMMQRTKEIWMYKQNTQPLSARSAGCAFKNPPGSSAGLLIDQAGLKGLTMGGAQVSTRHANFIVAGPGCTADDVMTLMKLVQQRVLEAKGVRLEPEVTIWP